MAIKPFEQVYPGQNNPNRQPKQGKEVEPAEWERKQRLKEYRIASRREKRNRKSDEKKQRKLNATILRRMTRNPTKYNKNAGRNRLRAIEQERRKIQTAAVNMVQRLAAVYDPSGALFNVKPVTTLEDGRVVSLEAIERKKEREAEKALKNEMKAQEDQSNAQDPSVAISDAMGDRLNPERMKMLIESKMTQPRNPAQGMSKTQLKKQEMFAPRPLPPKPTIPEGIDLPSDEEENWLDLWSLPDEELERRVLREKKKKAKERKDLRVKQKTGKAERRAARDEKRRVYREIKQSWKVLREEERRRRKQLSAIEDEETKKIAIEVTNMHRQQAMQVCADLGFTLKNVEGVDEIVPKALGMKGVNVDFEKLEVVGDRGSGLIVKDEQKGKKPKGNRVDLGAIADEKNARNVSGAFDDGHDGSMNGDFVELGSDLPGGDHEELNYNHRVRRKLRRAIESAQVAKELLVREAAIKYCEEKGMEVPAVLRTAAKPETVRGARTMPDGTLETAKQERVRSRVELTEFNKMAKILRQQAKSMAIEAGIRIYLELTGRIPKREGLDEMVEAIARAKLPPGGTEPAHERAGEGGEYDYDDYDEQDGVAIGGIWPAQSTAAMTMEDFLAGWPMPEDPLASAPGQHDGGHPMAGPMDVDEEESEDSAAKQLQIEMATSNGATERTKNADGSPGPISDDAKMAGSSTSSADEGNDIDSDSSDDDASDTDTDMSDAS